MPEQQIKPGTNASQETLMLQWNENIRYRQQEHTVASHQHQRQYL